MSLIKTPIERALYNIRIDAENWSISVSEQVDATYESYQMALRIPILEPRREEIVNRAQVAYNYMTVLLGTAHRLEKEAKED